MIRAVTFDFWDTLVFDDSDEPKRAALGLPSKADTRRQLLTAEVQQHHPRLGTAQLSAATVSASGNITTAAIGVFNGSFIKIPTGTTDPAGAVLGAAYYNTFNSTWRVYNGVSWVNA